MIKVNLLKDQTARVRKTTPRLNISWIGLVFLAIFLLGAGCMAAWTYTVKRQIDAGAKTRDQLQKEYDQLKDLQKKVAAYDKLKQQRLDRIRVIEELKEGQSGPVLLLNAVIRSIPQNAELFLTSVTQKSDSIKIVGQTPRAEVIPDLMNNLIASGIFSIVDLELIDRKEDTSRFSLNCTSAKKPQAE
jgi:type IV pilus assembly protein PilN